MSVEVHVDARVTQGQLVSFSKGVDAYLTFARDHGYTVPKVLQGLSGPMNSIRLIYQYDDLCAYEEHEARTLVDVDYAEAASAMKCIEGSVLYTIFREVAREVVK